MLTRAARPSLSLILAASLAGCGASSSGSDPATVAVAVQPPQVSVPVTETQPFQAVVTGTANTAVTWSVTAANGGTVGPEGGTVSAGLYTAPGAPGSFRVVATSVADTSKSGAAAVTVTPIACGNVGQACCAGNACSSGTCTGGTCVASGGTHAEESVDPVDQPTNNGELNVTDQASSPLIVQDKNPAGGGDLLGLFLAGNSTHYLLVSTNGGQSWTYRTATGGTKPTGTNLGAAAIVQDTVSYKLHWVTYPNGGPNALYHRVALAYTGGHVSGWSWETADRIGPAFAHNGTKDPFPKLSLNEIVDGNGVHLLALAGVDQPASGPFRRLVAARTKAAVPLAPTSASDWGQLTDGSGAFSILGAWYAGTAGSEGLAKFPNTDTEVQSHSSSLCFSQSGDGALHFFTGTFFYNDTDGHGDITRWRLTRSGANWAPETSGAAVGTTNATYRPCVGNCVGTDHYAWFTWGDVNGLHIGRVDEGGTWQADAIASPDTTTGVYWYSALGVSNTGEAWLMWERNPGNKNAVERAGYWNGATWTTQTDTSLWQRNTGFTYNSEYAGAAAWTPIGRLTDGVGVMAYGYGDWGGLGQDEYSIHVYH